MTRNFRDYLEDILTAIDETREFTENLVFQEFTGDRKTINAVIRSLEVLGEATKRLPQSIRVLAPNLPWSRMAGMRDKLIHEYFGVDLEIVWHVVHEELPPLRCEIEKLLRELPTTD